MAKNRSVKAEEIIALSKKEGFLAKQLYVVFTTPTNGIGPVMENVKEHLAFQVRLEKEGTMFAAGDRRREIVGRRRHGRHQG